MKNVVTITMLLIADIQVIYLSISNPEEKTKDNTANDDPTIIPPENPINYILMDSGQTISYTNTFGEDSDYNINPVSLSSNGYITPAGLTVTVISWVLVFPE